MSWLVTSKWTRECWKEHTCVNCSGVFACWMKATAKGGGMTRGEAEDNACANAEAMIQADDRMQPCPICGAYQPEMIARWRLDWHRSLLILAAVGLVGVVVLLLLPNFRHTQVAQLATAGALGMMMIQVIVIFQDPNRHLEANRTRARQQVNKGTLEVVCEGKEGEEFQHGPRWKPVWLLGVAALAMASSELLRLGFDWPLNPDVYPAIVGPGDQTRFTFTEPLQGSINALWSGVPSADVLNADEVGLANRQLPAHTQTDQWARRIRSPRTRHTTGKALIWMRLQVPEQADLAGKTLTIQARVRATYPAPEGILFYEDHEKVLEQTVKLALASPYAGRIYNTTWWLGVLGGWTGVLVICLGNIMAASQLRRLALPTVLRDAAEDA